MIVKELVPGLIIEVIREHDGESTPQARAAELIGKTELVRISPAFAGDRELYSYKSALKTAKDEVLAVRSIYGFKTK